MSFAQGAPSEGGMGCSTFSKWHPPPPLAFSCLLLRVVFSPGQDFKHDPYEGGSDGDGRSGETKFSEAQARLLPALMRTLLP